MKIQCNVCETAEATVLCCADEAALCTACDEKVHAANKLASKHPRVPLSVNSSQMPKCDICQEAVGYFFCLEDRALLCRKCDLAIHTANPFVSSHQRFLLTGVKVGLEPSEPTSCSSMSKSASGEKPSDAETASVHNHKTIPMSVDVQYNRPIQTGFGNMTPSKKRSLTSLAGEYPEVASSVQNDYMGDFSQSRMSFAGGSATGSIPQWHIDDFLELSGLNQHAFGYLDNGTSKADSGKLGESDSSSILRSSEDELDTDERLGQVPDLTMRVPQISPPTASGLHWGRSTSVDWNSMSSFSVPDISPLPAARRHNRAPRYQHN